MGCFSYVKTPRGLRQLHTVFAGSLDEACKRRFYKNFKASKGKAFERYQKVCVFSRSLCVLVAHWAFSSFLLLSSVGTFLCCV